MNVERGSIMGNFVNRLIRDESGQDLVEYGLLAAIIAMAAVLVLPPLRARMGTAFATWERNMNNNWVPKDPQ